MANSSGGFKALDFAVGVHFTVLKRALGMGGFICFIYGFGWVCANARHHAQRPWIIEKIQFSFTDFKRIITAKKRPWNAGYPFATPWDVPE